MILPTRGQKEGVGVLSPQLLETTVRITLQVDKVENQKKVEHLLSKFLPSGPARQKIQ